MNTQVRLTPLFAPTSEDTQRREWEARDRCAREGSDLLKRMGYAFDRDAAIGVWLTAATWERFNGAIEPTSSEVDFYDEIAGTPFGTTSKDRRARRQREQKAKADAFNACLGEYVQREHPHLARLPSTSQAESVSPTAQDLAEHQAKKLSEKIKRPFTGKRNTHRDSAGRFAREHADAE